MPLYEIGTRATFRLYSAFCRPFCSVGAVNPPPKSDIWAVVMLAPCTGTVTEEIPPAAVWAFESDADRYGVACPNWTMTRGTTARRVMAWSSVYIAPVGGTRPPATGMGHLLDWR